MRMSHIIFLVENRAILYIVIFFHGKDGYGEIALYNTGLLGVEETLHRYKKWSLISHTPQDPRINIVNLKLVV